MKRHNLRRLPRISYSEFEEPSLDEYVYCDKCMDFVFEYCSIHGPLLVLPDDEVPAVSPYPPCVPRAALTIPHVFLHIAPSIIPGAGLGVFSSLTLPRGVRFGPYIGVKTQKMNSYCWQIRDSNNKWSHVVDASDPNASNWMRYVNCSRHWAEQNLVAYQYQGQIYYRTIKIIPKFTELMVFYGSEFAVALNIDLGRYNAPRGYAQRYGVPASKKPKLPLDVKKIDETKVESSSKKKPLFGGSSAKKSSNTEEKCRSKTHKDNSKTSNVPDKTNLVLSNSKSIDCNNNLNTSKQIDASYVCDYCKKHFTDKTVFTEHLKIHTKDKPFQCNVCKKRFSDKSYFYIHLRSHTGVRPFECDYCKKRFTLKCNLTKHLRIHTGERTFECEYCKKRFSVKSHLTEHLKIHTGERPFECEYCKKSFTQKNDLTKHLKIHTGERPFECEYCKKSFTQKNDLTKHLRIHTGERPFECEYCKKSFTQKNVLTTHLRIHTGERPFECEYCKKSFTQKIVLTTHLRIHTGERPFECKYCKKCFTRKSYLTTHLKKHTRENIRV